MHSFFNKYFFYKMYILYILSELGTKYLLKNGIMLIMRQLSYISQRIINAWFRIFCSLKESLKRIYSELVKSIESYFSKDFLQRKKSVSAVNHSGQLSTRYTFSIFFPEERKSTSHDNKTRKKIYCKLKIQLLWISISLYRIES